MYNNATAPRVGDIRNIKVYAVVFRGNNPTALKNAYDAYYTIDKVSAVASALNIVTAGKSIGQLVSEIADSQFGNPSSVTKDGIIQGLHKLEGLMYKSHIQGLVKFYIIVEWEKLEIVSGWFGSNNEWVKHNIPSKEYTNGIQYYYRIHDPYDMRQMIKDINKAMIEFPKTVKIQ